MLKGLFVFLSRADWAQRLITRWRFAWRTASRFVAGETLEEALQAVRRLNQLGMTATLDHLGEDTTSMAEARQAGQEALRILQEIDRTGICCNVSIKLSQLGLRLDEEGCRRLLIEILEAARAWRNFIRIDMEDSTLVEPTLSLYRWARRQGFDNLGIAVQAYLYRSRADLEQLIDLQTRVRLVKGAYREPPRLAFPRKRDVDHNFDRLADLLLEAADQAGAPLVSSDGRFPPIPAIATHDIKRIRYARETGRRLGLPKGAIEFQMLYGIRRDLQLQLVQAGYPLRIYVPYGTHWYPYLMRRLGERPANVWFFISNFFRK